MFLNGLKEKSILRKLKIVNDARDFTPSKRPIERVYILQQETAPIAEKAIVSLVHILGIKRESVKVLTFVKALKKQDLQRTDVFTSKQIGWKAVLKPQFLKEWVTVPYDLLLSYYKGEVLPLQVLTTLSSARFKVGIDEDHYEMNDLIITTELRQEAILIQEVEKYLKILKIGK